MSNRWPRRRHHPSSKGIGASIWAPLVLAAAHAIYAIAAAIAAAIARPVRAVRRRRKDDD